MVRNHWCLAFVDIYSKQEAQPWLLKPKPNKNVLSLAATNIPHIYRGCTKIINFSDNVTFDFCLTHDPEKSTWGTITTNICYI